MAATKGQRAVLSTAVFVLAQAGMAATHEGVLGMIVGCGATLAAWKLADDVFTSKEKGEVASPQPLVERGKVRDFTHRLLTPRAQRRAEAGLGEEDEATPQGERQASGEAQPLFPKQENHQECLHLGLQLVPHADWMLSNRVTILGMPEAGKSNLVAVIAEEIGGHGGPVLILDTEGEYGKLCSVAYWPHKPRRGDASTVTVENAFEAGWKIVAEGLQVVLDLSSYDDPNVAAECIVRIIAGIRAFEEEEKAAGREPVACTVILEEATFWLPQIPRESILSKEKDEDGTTVLERLQQTFFRVVRQGRKRGMGIIFSTQRPAEIDNRAIAVSEWKFLLKANMPNDLEVYRKLGVSGEIASSLKKGEAFVIGPRDIKGVYQIRRRHSPDDAKTPGLASFKRYQQGSPTTEPIPERYARYMTAKQQPKETVQQKQQGSTPVQQERTAQGERPHLALVREETQGSASQKVTPQRIAGIPAELQQAAQVFQPGMSSHDLAKALPCSSAEARILWQELRKYMRVLERQERAYQLVANGRPVAESQATQETADDLLDDEEEQPGLIKLGKDQKTGKNVTITQEQFRIAVRLRQSGMSTGYRDLMGPFELGETHAKALNKLIRKELGLAPE